VAETKDIKPGALGGALGDRLSTIGALLAAARSHEQKRADVKAAYCAAARSALDEAVREVASLKINLESLEATLPMEKNDATQSKG
jgi:hypothetical protein